MNKKIVLLLSTAIAMIGILFPCIALAEDVIYTGIALQELSIRLTQSKSAKKLGIVEDGEQVQIIEAGKEWFKIEKDGEVGYILGKYIAGIVSVQEGTEVPESLQGRAVPIQPDGEQVLYFGEVTRDLTIRETKSKSGKKAGAVLAGEAIDILELGKEWFYIVKDGKAGYILSKYVKDLTAAIEGVEIPAQYVPEPIIEFIELYIAVADTNLSVRKSKDANSKMLATVYEDEKVTVSNVDEEWALVKKGKKVGYVLADHLKQFKAIDPYMAMIPNAEYYPYAATVINDVTITDKFTGEALQTIPAGSIISVRTPFADGSVELPYKRTTGVIASGDDLMLMSTKLWDKAEPDELLAAFSTFFDPEESSSLRVGRIHNIIQGVERIDGSVIEPQASFSFNQVAAPYTKGNGYELGPIINYVSSQKSGYGGGICQVSTTLYNALLQVPAKIVRSQPHSSVGIDYAPLDFDEAVGNGNIDLVFENHLPYSIRLALKSTDGVVTVMIYRNE